MATMYRPKSGKETPGEALLYDKFQSLLPEDFMVWHNQVPPHRDREIDFVVLHPTYGIWIAEVKDWAIDQLSEVDTDFVTLTKSGTWGLGRSSRDRHPLRQARENLIAIKEALQKQRILANPDGPHAGKLIVPINSFAILVNISREDLSKSPFGEHFDEKRVWTGDFVSDPYETDDGWLKKLLETREIKFQSRLDAAQLNAVKRSIGVAAVRAPTTQPPSESGQAAEDAVGTLDDHQSQLVQQEVRQQITIEGPAGSGKSIVLLKRAIHIHQEYPHWRIGILCFNTLMANYLRTLLDEEEQAESLRQAIDVYDVYQWIEKVGLPGVAFTIQKSYDEALKTALDSVSWKVARQYDALLIDEGQDSTDTLIRLYRAMLLDPDEGSFTFFFDRRQVLYQGSIIDQLEGYGFSIDAKKNLVKQQRSALVLLALAYFEGIKGGSDADTEQVVEKTMKAAEKMFFGWRSLGKALVSGTQRIFKQLVQFVSRQPNDATAQPQSFVLDLGKELDEAFGLVKAADGERLVEQIVSRISLLHSKGQASFGEMTILVASRYYGPGMGQVKVLQRIQEELGRREVPYVYVAKEGLTFDGKEVVHSGDNRREASLGSDAVKIMTIHAAKGFDSSYVFVAGFDAIHAASMAEIGYVALTRARKRCEVYYCNDAAEPVKHLDSVLQSLRKRRIEVSA